MGDRKYRDVRMNGLALKSWPLYTDIREAYKVINVPIAGGHGLSTLTPAMKNWTGVMGGRRSRIHRNIDESFVDIAGAVKPALTVLDACGATLFGLKGSDLEYVRLGVRYDLGVMDLPKLKIRRIQV
jgi:hypothetical protein